MAKLFFLSALFICFSFLVNGQTKDSVRKKLKDLEGDSTKITITTEKGEITFEGEEAEYLLRKMKKQVNTNSLTYNSDEDYFDGGSEFYFNDPHFVMPKIPKVKIMTDWDDDLSMLDEYNKKITVEKNDGKTKVTVKWKQNGDDVTETYEGEDAEKYLKELNEEEPVSFNFKSDEDKDTRIIIIK